MQEGITPSFVWWPPRDSMWTTEKTQPFQVHFKSSLAIVSRQIFVSLHFQGAKTIAFLATLCTLDNKTNICTRIECEKKIALKVA